MGIYKQEEAGCNIQNKRLRNEESLESDMKISNNFVKFTNYAIIT